jgi:RHS repeat-associated protein
MEIIGNRELTYLYAGGMPFAIHQKEGENEQLYYLHLDYQGSIRAITNEQGTVVEERDYDSCSLGFRFLQAVCAVKTIAPSIPKKRSELREGRPRDPNTLEYTATNPFSVSTITNRGYTFHVRETWLFAKSPSRTIPLCGKHIFEFSLVNMNARMGVYPANSGNPVLRRVISPDNYIQAPDNTQSFNRYSYCWNNPLKYTDPDGNFIMTILTAKIDFVATAFTKGGLDPTSKNARQNAWTNFDPTKKGTKTNNAWRIDMGKFKTDPNKEWYERGWQLISRFTWESPQSGLGNMYSHLRNITGNVDRVDYFGGATFVTNENARNRDGVSIGNFININHWGEIEGNFEQHVINDPLYMHEFGHTFDSRRFGFLYLLMIGVPSLHSAATSERLPNEPRGVTTHDFRWYEMRANRHAKKYFGEYYGVDWENRLMRQGTYETYYPTRRR